ncbi:DEAD/DEAH box helicase [Algicola sagamiensis]|uniref:DEAD/DEAH box helicase n=1 Tax=Algicola sagamiensis TaxID=163869 RepID=UPI000375371F|nr:DEAD/DEAH box helicase [Algicola sagamiensis]
MSSSTVFSELNLSAPLLQAIEELGYVSPTEIQEACIPMLLEGRDVLGLAQTGTGKTAAFALPLLDKIDLSQRCTQVIVLAPTRELALQVTDAFNDFSKHISGLSVLPVYGGQSFKVQLDGLKRHPKVVVGTPGRVIDHLNRGTLKLDGLKALVLDEADEMLRMGFIDDVETILQHTPETKQMALFSATMPKEIQRITKRYLNDPQTVQVSPRNSTKGSIAQSVWFCNHVHKKDALLRLLQADLEDAAIVFARTKQDTIDIATWLQDNKVAALPLNGDMNQAHREQTIQQLKSGKTDVVVATDVAARGIDVERIALVVNYDLPFDSEAYVHRIGRTGRAGRSGKAITFVKQNQKRLLRQIERDTSTRLEPMGLPSVDDVLKLRKEQLKEKVLAEIAKPNMERFANIVREIQSELENVQDADLLTALLALAQAEEPLFIKDFPKPKRGEYNDRGERGDRRRRDRNDRNGRDRGERGERGDRGDRRDRKPRRSSNEKMECFRIEVGLEHGVQAKNIVGAIANEADISSKFIGQIKLFDNHSTVELPEGMPSDVLTHLNKVYVCNRQLKMKRMQ